jgi:vacuolar-type H+-ATPase subunit H
MRRIAGMLILSLVVCAAPLTSEAQSLIITTMLGPNQIGQIKTAQGITTRITFPETVGDIVCGDLYDPATGKGSFVVQRIDNDVFLKPVVSKALSNLFVKTGSNGGHTYAFDLQVVPLEQANRVVNVVGAPSTSNRGTTDPQPNVADRAIAQEQADEIIRSARQQAHRIIAQANQEASEIYNKAVRRAEDVDRTSAERAEQQVEERFVRAMIQGLKEVKSAGSRVSARRITVILDPRVLTFDNKSYLRYTIKNSGGSDFSFSGIALERRSGAETFLLPVKVIQGRAENKLGPGETIIGIIVFDAKDVGALDKLTLCIRGEGDSEIARLAIQ